MCFFWIVCKCTLNICCCFHCTGHFPMRLCQEKESFLALHLWQGPETFLYTPNILVLPHPPPSHCVFSITISQQNLFHSVYFVGYFSPSRELWNPSSEVVHNQCWENIWSWFHPQLLQCLGRKEGDTHRGQFNSLTVSKTNNHPSGMFWYFCYLPPFYLKAEQTPNQEQWWHLCCGEFS